MNTAITVALVAAVGLAAVVLVDRELNKAKRSAFGGFGGLEGLGRAVGGFFSGLNQRPAQRPTDELSDADKQGIFDMFADDGDGSL